ncbi:MAG: DUF547 domain-containing protein [Blastocatellia bacterium]|nr:DUF547 domain-containing protein [Blastocatellia bacterium]
MKTKLVLTLSVLALLTRLACAFEGEAVAIPSGISHGALDALLKKYVNDRGLVAYADWKKNRTDLDALDSYLKQFAAKPETPATGNDQAASLINLYNASTIRWILTNYPTDSIMALSDSFGAGRHEIGGRKASLNDIEHGSVRPLIGYRGHAVLVCAARSCPPLQRFAYTPDQLDGQIDTAYRAWLGREDLNRFLSDKRKIEISSIFNWFKDDFEKAGGVKPVLAKSAPQKYHDFLAAGDYEITYLPYNWGLNDQGAQGKSYSRARLLWDQIIDKLQFWK